MAIFDLHVHTVKGSSDSSLTTEQLISEARRIGLDGVCLSEHSGGWDDHEFRRVFEDSGLVVVRGLEVDTEMGHVLAYGMHQYVGGIHRVRDLRHAADRLGAFLVSAHPFRNLFNNPPYNLNLLFRERNGRPSTPEQAALHPLFEVVDDIEVGNGANTERENAFTLEVAQILGFEGTGGSDAHSTHGLGKFATEFDGDIRSESDFVEALRTGAYRAVQGLHVGELRAFGLNPVA